MFPWQDNLGRFAPFKALVFALLFVPGIWTAVDFAVGNLQPRPINAAVHEIGLWSLRLLFLALAVTPLRFAWAWSRLLQVRRMLGVAAFAYVLVHLLLYVADQSFKLGTVLSEIVLRIYLAIGMVALLMLAALAVTSTDRMIRRLGAKRWRRLHMLVYPAALLGLIHHYMQSKVRVDEPLVMSGLLFWLFAWRLIARLSGGDQKVRPWVVPALALLAAVLTACGEAGYYWWLRGIDPLRVLNTNFVMLGWRPAWVVFAICLPLAVISIVRLRLAPGARPRLRPARAT